MLKITCKKIALLMVTVLFSFNYIWAADDPEVVPIILKPTIPNNPDIPKSPSRVRISAYYDGSAVVLTSTVATMAEVVISDTETGAYCFNGLAALAPDFRCPVCTTPGSSLTITVTVGATVYEGTLVL